MVTNTRLFLLYTVTATTATTGVTSKTLDYYTTNSYCNNTLTDYRQHELSSH